MPCSGPLGANLSSSSHGSKGAWVTFVHLGEGGKPDHGREHWLGVGGWVFAIPQLLTLNLSFHHPETVMPTSEEWYIAYHGMTPVFNLCCILA